jgi:hypothetical protein
MAAHRGAGADEVRHGFRRPLAAALGSGTLHADAAGQFSQVLESGFHMTAHAAPRAGRAGFRGSGEPGSFANAASSMRRPIAADRMRIGTGMRRPSNSPRSCNSQGGEPGAGGGARQDAAATSRGKAGLAEGDGGASTHAAHGRQVHALQEFRRRCERVVGAAFEVPGASARSKAGSRVWNNRAVVPAVPIPK